MNQLTSGQADLVAVWDATKKKFENDARVLFIPIPTAVPNDFLVASGISDFAARLIVDAIRKDPAAGRPCTDLRDSLSGSDRCHGRGPCACTGVDPAFRPRDDFDAWYAWDSNASELTDQAREALVKLRQDAGQAPTPVVVRIEGRPREGIGG